jgi:hypothetical protein
MKESSRTDEDYTCSWYRRYRQTVEISPDGTEVHIIKPTYASKDQLVDLTTSFNHGTGSDEWACGEGDSGEGAGIFASLFAS